MSLPRSADGREVEHPRDGDDPAAPPVTVLGELQGALASAREAVTHFLGLLRLEAILAGRSFLWVLALVLMAGVLIVSAWLGLSAALVMAIQSAGPGILAAVLIVSALNLLAALAMILLCGRLSRNLRFSATRRQFGVGLSGTPEP
jgi:hypothetical protein